MKRFSREIRSKQFFILFLFFAIGLILYANSFSNQMFWDDEDSILNNQYVHSWHYFPKFFSENLIAGAGLVSNYWRPILLTVFSLEWHLWRDWAFGYHFVNTLFHIIDAILLFFILFYILKNYYLSLFTSLIFLVHPLQTEAVTYVAGFGDPLSVFFIFLGILFYLKFRLSSKRAIYFFSVFCYALALMSKETAIIMPALIFIIDFLFFDKDLKLSDKTKEAVKRLLPFIVIAIIYVLLRATVLNFSNIFNFYDEKNIFSSNIFVRLFTFFRILTVYFGLLFLPLHLHMERTVEIATFPFLPSVIAGGFLFIFLIILAVLKYKKSPILSFGIFWFFITLFPVSNILIPINGLLYEHWLYLPLIGIFLILVWKGINFSQRFHLQKIFLVGFIFYLIFFGVLTVKRNRDWHDPITFYNQTLRYAPNSYRVINNLGMAYDDKGDYEKAKEMYKRAIDLDPSNPVAYHNLAGTYLSLGNNELAIKNYEKAISLDPQFIFSWRALLDFYLKNNNYQQATALLEDYFNFCHSKEVKIDTLFLLFQLSLEQKNYNAAQSYLESALKINPENRVIQQYLKEIKNLAE